MINLSNIKTNKTSELLEQTQPFSKIYNKLIFYKINKILDKKDKAGIRK